MTNELADAPVDYERGLDPAASGKHFTFVLPAMESYSAACGGAIATVTRQICRCLAEENEVSVISPDDGECPYPDGRVTLLRFGPAQPIPVPVHKANVLECRLRRWSLADYRSYLQEVKRALRYLRQPLDVVVVANDPEMAHILGQRHQVVLWLHNYLSAREARRLPTLPNSVRIVAVSAAVADWTAQRYSLRRSDITVIHNGVDLSEFHPRVSYVEPRSPLKVVCHGRIDRNKGFDLVARAVEMLREEGLPVALTVVGGSRTFGLPEGVAQGYERELAALVEAAGGVMTGRQSADEVAAILREHDVACAPSRSQDPFPLSAVEAMASGCAIVVTRSGGLPEAVGDGGAVIEIDDLAALGDQLRLLATDPEALRSRKVASFIRSQEMGWDRGASALVALTAQGSWGRLSG